MADIKDTDKVTKSDMSRKSLHSSRKVGTKIKPNVDDTMVESGSKRKASEEVIVPNIKKTMVHDVVDLNVGGKIMTTLLETLRKEPDSMLAAMFSGRHVISKDKEGRYFIDCDGGVFKYILDYLRFGKLPSQEMALDVYDLACYFQIVTLQEKMELFHSVKYRNLMTDLKKKVDRKEYEKRKQKAIYGIEECIVGPQEDKALHFFYMGNYCGYCVIFKESLKTTQIHALTIHTNILIENDNESKKEEELMRLLAYELRELGFAKYTITKEKIIRCSNCSKGQIIKQIILLSH